MPMIYKVSAEELGNWLVERERVLSEYPDLMQPAIRALDLAYARQIESSIGLLTVNRVVNKWFPDPVHNLLDVRSGVWGNFLQRNRHKPEISALQELFAEGVDVPNLGRDAGVSRVERLSLDWWQDHSKKVDVVSSTSNGRSEVVEHWFDPLDRTPRFALTSLNFVYPTIDFRDQDEVNAAFRGEKGRINSLVTNAEQWAERNDKASMVIGKVMVTACRQVGGEPEQLIERTVYDTLARRYLA